MYQILQDNFDKLTAQTDALITLKSKAYSMAMCGKTSFDNYYWLTGLFYEVKEERDAAYWELKYL